MNINDLQLLASPAGQELLNKYQNYQDQELENLMFKVEKSEREIMRAVVTLIKLRHRAKDKFSLAEKMFFTADGQEQSTGEKIAEYIAGRFGEGLNIVDLTCSIGGNLVYLAQKNNLTAVDQNEANLFCAQKNAEVYGVAGKIKFVLGQAEENLISGTDAFFMDPERAREGKSKTKSILNSSPNLAAMLPEMLKITKNIGIKISPAFDYAEIKKLPEIPEVEIISEDNVCKVAMLWFGKYKTCQRRATMFIRDEKYSLGDNEKKIVAPLAESLSTFVYEPNKAIIKAHLIDEVCEEFSLKKLNPQIAYLTGEQLSQNKDIFRTLRVITFDKYSLKNVQKIIKEHGVEKGNIISRGFPVSNEDLYKKLKIKEGGDLFLIFTTFQDNKYYFVLSELEKNI